MMHKKDAYHVMVEQAQVTRRIRDQQRQVARLLKEIAPKDLEVVGYMFLGQEGFGESKIQA